MGSDLRESKSKMLGERIFKISVNLVFLGCLYKIMLGDDCTFFDVRLGGKTSHPLYFYNHPCQMIPSSLDSFYLFKLGYHCYELIHTSLMDRKRSDFIEYLLHHFLTFTLILFSYQLNYLPVGAAVMVLHDITDMTASVFKLCVDVTPFTIQMLSYALMLVSWIYFRLWFFPVHVIARIYEESQNWHGSPMNGNFVSMLSTFLSVLFCMHVFWFYIMLKGLAKRLSKSDYKNHVSMQSSVNRGQW